MTHLVSNLKEKPLTSRGVLSILSSIYDPLVFGTSFLVKGKQIIQKLCQLNLNWDEDIPDEISNEKKINMERKFTQFRNGLSRKML